MLVSHPASLSENSRNQNFLTTTGLEWLFWVAHLYFQGICSRVSLMVFYLFFTSSLGLSFLSCSTYSLAIGFLLYRVLRLVLSTFSDEGSFAYSFLQPFSVEILWHHSQRLQRAFTAAMFAVLDFCCGTCVSPWLCIAMDLLVLVQVTHRNHYPTTL